MDMSSVILVYRSNKCRAALQHNSRLPTKNIQDSLPHGEHGCENVGARENCL